MVRHVILIVSLTIAALTAGVALVPGEREQWTMLVRDGRNQEALRALEARYRAGHRDMDAVLHLHKLYMSFSDIERATRIMEDFAAERPRDPAALALLARHYGDIQDKRSEIATLERLFALAPSLPTAHSLLSYYRLEGDFSREERLLRTLLANNLITANDAERLGLMLASNGDLYGARDALTRFDEIANPERTVGRFALFDVLVQIGDKSTALSRGASWTVYWRKASMHRGADSDRPAARLIRMMLALDEVGARRALCEVQREELDDTAAAAHSPYPLCDITVPDGTAASQPSANNGVTSAEPRDEIGRRRRR